MKSVSGSLRTPLGDLKFSVVTEPEISSADEVAIKIFEYAGDLPPGMSVDSSNVALLKFRASQPTSILRFLCWWSEMRSKGSRESGEGLDAQSWEDDVNVVMVGTEDADFLTSRLRLEADVEAVEYLEDGMLVTIRNIPAYRPISAQFVVATNQNPEPAADSVWFAVDIPHLKVLKTTEG